MVALAESDRNILAACSSCVRGLPAEATEWDISKLVVEGQAVEQSIVLAWLNAMYIQIQDEPFEQQEDNPASNMRGLAHLLAFADAVGSSRGLLRSLSAGLDDLVAEVRFDDLPANDQGQAKGRQLPLCLEGNAYYIWVSESSLRLMEWLRCDPECAGGEVVANLGTTARKAAMLQQVVLQLEKLLYYAHTLKLPALQHKLHGFIRLNTSATDSLLFGSMGQVVSDRVVAAVADQDFCKQAVINSMVTEQGGLMEHNHAEAIFHPIDDSVPSLDFLAVLARDAFGCNKGDTVRASVFLTGAADESVPCIRINEHDHVVQLLIGPLVRGNTTMHALTGPSPGGGGSSKS